MIKTETVTINGKQFVHTYSDEGRYVVREGVEYEEAYDPAELDRQYTEGEEIHVTDEEVLNILIGGAE